MNEMKNKKPNIIFITIDSLRPKNLGCYGYKRNTSPNIDALAKKGTLFKNFFSSYNSTHKSFFSILSGRRLLLKDFMIYPSQREINYFFETEGILLSEILQKQGYKTYFLKKLFGWQKRGFDYSFKQDSQEESNKWNFIKSLKKTPLIYNFFKFILHNTYFIPRRLESKIRFNDNGEIITNEGIEIIKQNKENSFFLWLHYQDTHVPHIFPYNLNNKFISNKQSKNIFDIFNSKKGRDKRSIDFLRGCWKFDDTVDGIIAKYDTAIFYDDFLVGKIIETLKKEKLLKDTIIFLFSDHGVSFGEHEIYFTSAGIYDVSFNIPLIIFGRGIPKGKIVNALTNLEDISQTILDLIGIKYDSLSFDGKSLSPLLFGKKEDIRKSILLEEQACGIKKRAIRTKKYKYMESPDKKHSICKTCNTTHGPILALYDLEKDPNENINLAKKNKKLTREMKSKLNEILRDLKTLNEKRRIKNIINKTKLD